jgi:multidrug efflux system outer membrane protein
MQKPGLMMVFIALVFGGCTMIPDYERPAAPVLGTYPGVTSVAGESSAANISLQDFVKE